MMLRSKLTKSLKTAAARDERAAAEAAAVAAERAADAADMAMLKYQLQTAEADRLKAVQVLLSSAVYRRQMGT
jgi:hypothetical protein